ADASLALPSNYARELSQVLHDQSHGLVLGDGMVDLDGRVARRQLEHPAIRQAERRFEPRQPEISRRHASPPLALVRNDLMPSLILHRFALRAAMAMVKSERPIFA